MDLYRAEHNHVFSGAQEEAASYKNVILSEDLQKAYIYWKIHITTTTIPSSPKKKVSEATLGISTSDHVCN